MRKLKFCTTESMEPSPPAWVALNKVKPLKSRMKPIHYTFCLFWIQHISSISDLDMRERADNLTYIHIRIFTFAATIVSTKVVLSKNQARKWPRGNVWIWSLWFVLTSITAVHCLHLLYSVLYCTVLYCTVLYWNLSAWNI